MKLTQTEIAAHLDLSQSAVSQMIGDGTLPRPTNLGGTTLDDYRVLYIRHLRERAAGRASDGAEAEGLDLVQERARLAAAQADAQEMRNRLMAGETLMADEVERVLGAVVEATRARLIAIPSKAAPSLVGITSVSVMQARLTELIHEALDDLSATEFEAVPGGKLRKVQPLAASRH